MEIQFTGNVDHRVVPITSVEYGFIGAYAEIQMGIRPDADESFQGLWSSEALRGDDALATRSACRDSHIGLMLSSDGDENVEADIEAVIEHLARVNRLYAEQVARGQAAARVAVEKISG